MNNNNQTIIIGLLTLIFGLILGYYLGNSTVNDTQGMHMSESMHGEMEDSHSYGEEIIDGDGAMIHAMDEMMLGFRGKTGAEYEEAFLRGMIVHHIGAVEMAEGLLEETGRPELRTFAQDIINVQSQEIDTMKGWLEKWFNTKQ